MKHPSSLFLILSLVFGLSMSLGCQKKADPLPKPAPTATEENPAPTEELENTKIADKQDLPPTCHNNRLDPDEQAVDCGGPCAYHYGSFNLDLCCLFRAYMLVHVMGVLRASKFWEIIGSRKNTCSKHTFNF